MNAQVFSSITCVILGNPRGIYIKQVKDLCGFGKHIGGFDLITFHLFYY